MATRFPDCQSGDSLRGGAAQPPLLHIEARKQVELVLMAPEDLHERHVGLRAGDDENSHMSPRPPDSDGGLAKARKRRQVTPSDK